MNENNNLQIFKISSQSGSENGSDEAELDYEFDKQMRNDMLKKMEQPDFKDFAEIQFRSQDLLHELDTDRFHAQSNQ